MANTQPGLVPIGAILAWAKTLSGVPSLAAQGRNEYVECNGQTISNKSAGSMNGQVMPAVNTNNQFVRGNSTSGGTGGSVTVSGTVSISSITISGSTNSASTGIGLSQSTAQFDQTIPANSALTYDAVSDPGHYHDFDISAAGTGSVSTLDVTNPYYYVVYIIRIR